MAGYGDWKGQQEQFFHSKSSNQVDMTLAKAKSLAPYYTAIAESNRKRQAQAKSSAAEAYYRGIAEYCESLAAKGISNYYAAMRTTKSRKAGAQK